MHEKMDKPTEYIIQTKYGFRTEFIIVQDLSLENYLVACGEKFMFASTCNYNINLANQNGASIERNNFETVVKTYWRSASFCINLDATPIKSDSPAITIKVSGLRALFGIGDFMKSETSILNNKFLYDAQEN